MDLFEMVKRRRGSTWSISKLRRYRNDALREVRQIQVAIFIETRVPRISACNRARESRSKAIKIPGQSRNLTSNVKHVRFGLDSSDLLACLFDHVRIEGRRKQKSGVVMRLIYYHRRFDQWEDEMVVVAMPNSQWAGGSRSCQTNHASANRRLAAHDGVARSWNTPERQSLLVRA